MLDDLPKYAVGPVATPRDLFALPPVRLMGTVAKSQSAAVRP